MLRPGEQLEVTDVVIVPVVVFVVDIVAIRDRTMMEFPYGPMEHLVPELSSGIILASYSCLEVPLPRLAVVSPAIENDEFALAGHSSSN